MDQQETAKTPPGAAARPAAPPSEGSTDATPEAGEARPRLHARLMAWARAHPLLATAIVVGLAARIIFWAVTDRVIDDALITIKFDKNLANGFGLVHNLGDGRVQGFTSALSVLVPMPGELITPGGGLALIRLASLAAFVVTAIYADRICRKLKLGSWPIGLLLAYLALDQNQVFYGMSGMETQMAVAVLLAGIYYVMVEDYTKSGIALGFAVLARPDFVLWIAPALLFLLIRNWRRGLEAGLIAGLIVAPWVIFTTAYYGSLIPNTIVAKSAAFGPHFPSLTHVGAWIDFIGNTFSTHQHDWMTIAPFYERVFVLHAPLSYGLLKGVALAVVALAVVGAVSGWRRPGFRPAIAYVVLFLLYKFFYLNVGYFEWYGVPACALVLLLAAVGLDRVAVFVSSVIRRRVRLSRGQLAAIPAVLLAVVYGMQLIFTIPLESRIQHDIEDKVRLPLGQYLGRVAKTGQSITSESSGYVGYDTNATLYDYPGLVSRTAVTALRDAPVGLGDIPALATTLHPTWLVLRPGEIDRLRSEAPETARLYRRVRRFRVAPSSASLNVGGLQVFNVDEDFTVYRLRREQQPNVATRPVR